MAIDPHVHLRDWKQSEKETLNKGFRVANLAGLDGIFEMPNTSPALTSYILIQNRLEHASEELEFLSLKLFHGLYAGITDNPSQIEEVLRAYNDFERVVGLKMFAGQSTGNMGLINLNQQNIVYEVLSKNDFKGVLAVHCEKETYFSNIAYDPNNPITHAEIRNPESEIASIDDQIKLAEKNNFQGTLHIVHVSVPESLDLIDSYIKDGIGFNIVTGITPHHVVLHKDYMNGNDGVIRKMNPPLRSEMDSEKMLNALLQGKINWIETDHAPHTLKDKYVGFASGIPGLPFYPEFIKMLQEKGMSYDQIQNVTHNNIEKVFGLNIPNTNRIPNNSYKKLSGAYDFDAFEVLKR